MARTTRQNTTGAGAGKLDRENGWAVGPSAGSSAGSTIDLHAELPAKLGKEPEWPRVEALVEPGKDVDSEC